MSTHGKRGRPRKEGERYPSGQIRPAIYVTGNQYQRLRMITRDPLLGTELGRLGFLGELSPVEVEVGFTIARIQGSLVKDLWTGPSAVIIGTRSRRATRSVGELLTATPKLTIRPKPPAKPWPVSQDWNPRCME
jgi:hypothetical protein